MADYNHGFDSVANFVLLYWAVLWLTRGTVGGKMGERNDAFGRGSRPVLLY